jgi:hypothetical protein
MAPAAILEIIRLSLEITLEVIKGIPLEQRQQMSKQMWDDHQAAMAFWRNLLDR